MPQQPILRVGTRGSRLALVQANLVTEQLEAVGHTTRTCVIQTSGDRTSAVLSELGTAGIFTKEIQMRLVKHDIDVAVHSLKDLTTEQVPGTRLASVPQRMTVRDTLISRHPGGLAGLPPGARVGTSSPRRKALLHSLRPGLNIVGVRGNVETRIERVDSGEFDAVVLAEAGLQRLQMTHRIGELFDPDVFLPAVGQGALGIETRNDDEITRRCVESLRHDESMAAVIAERACLRALRGGCQAPIGAWGRAIGVGRFRLDALVISSDGQSSIRTGTTWKGQTEFAGSLQLAEQAGVDLAGELLDRGAAVLLASARGQQHE